MIELKFMRIAVRLRDKQRRNSEKYGDARKARIVLSRCALRLENAKDWEACTVSLNVLF